MRRHIQRQRYADYSPRVSDLTPALGLRKSLHTIINGLSLLHRITVLFAAMSTQVILSRTSCGRQKETLDDDLRQNMKVVQGLESTYMTASWVYNVFNKINDNLVESSKPGDCSDWDDIIRLSEEWESLLDEMFAFSNILV